MKKLRKFYLVLVTLLMSAALLAACGDPTATTAPATTAAPTKAPTTAAPTTAAPTTAAPTTVAPTATTAAPTTAPATTVAPTKAPTTAAATTAASGSSTAVDVPPYPGATILTVPDALKTQFLSSVGSNVKNPEVAALATPDTADKVKAFYTDYLSKNGWTDASASAGSGLSSIEQAGGFALIYAKGTRAFVVIGFPSSIASAVGFTETIPAGGTVAFGFTGEASLSAAGASTTAATSTTAAATTAAATTAAASSGSAGAPPAYAGAKILTLPDTIKQQFLTSVGTSVVNPDLGAFVTEDGADKVKAFYTDYLSKNGWTDITAAAAAGNSSASQIDSLGGFFLIYSKGKQAFVLIGLPSAIAAGFGVPASDIPGNGTLGLGFIGESK